MYFAHDPEGETVEKKCQSPFGSRIQTEVNGRPVVARGKSRNASVWPLAKLTPSTAKPLYASPETARDGASGEA
jgi:hypothetical protein